MRIAVFMTVLALAAGAAFAGLPTITVSIPDKSANEIAGVAKMDHLRDKDGELHFHIVNLAYEPKRILLKVTGLAVPEYEMYLDAASKGIFKKADLEAGVEIELKRVYIPAEESDCLHRMIGRIRAVTQQVYGKTEYDPKTVYDILSQVDSWIGGVTRSEHFWKSVDVILSPYGRPVQQGFILETKTEAMQHEIVDTLFLNIHRVRGFLADRIKDLDLRDLALSAVTLVDFEMTPEKVDPGKTSITTVRMTNRAKVGLSGTLRIEAPVGWEIKPDGDVSFSRVGLSQEAVGKFLVKAPAGGNGSPVPGAEIKIPACSFNIGKLHFDVGDVIFRTNSKIITPVSEDTPPPGAIPLPKTSEGPKPILGSR